MSPQPNVVSEMSKWQMQVPTDERGEHHERYGYQYRSSEHILSSFMVQMHAAKWFFINIYLYFDALKIPC